MQLNHLKNNFYNIHASLAGTTEAISDFIYRNPEDCGNEYVCSDYLIRLLKKHGFAIGNPLCGLETAFWAELSNGEGPTIAFLAEYDASYYKNIGSGKNEALAHIHGKNWLTAATVGTAICLSKMINSINGRILVIGIPPSEGFSLSTDIVKEGFLNNVNILFQPQPSNCTQLNCNALALDAIEFEFKGKPASTSSSSFDSINALDAVHLMFSGVNSLHRQLKDNTRISGIITNGGDTPALVPDAASCRFYVRAESREALDKITQRVIDCAKGAELMTQSSMGYRYFENSSHEISSISLLQSILKRNLISQGIVEFSEHPEEPTAPSHLGNISKVCPSLFFKIDVEQGIHFSPMSGRDLDQITSQHAKIKLHQTIKALGASALELFSDKKLVTEIQEVHMGLGK